MIPPPQYQKQIFMDWGGGRMEKGNKLDLN